MRDTIARTIVPIATALLMATLLLAAIPTVAQQTTLAIDPARTTVAFTLDAALHTVHGVFRAKPGELEFNSASGKLSGEIDVDARSGNTSNGMRDRKMHMDVLESERYPDISFRPDHVAGTVANQGKSSVKVHGIFRIHGVDREVDVPAQVEMFADHWSATVHFIVPYAKWGMKNPSTLFLRVGDSVEIELVVAGAVVQHHAENRTTAQ
jgi:polyisoprenoid-binding protein YceI